MDDIKKILEDYKNGNMNLDDAAGQVSDHYFTDLGHTILDNNRMKRTGFPEVIYCAGKTPAQVSAIFKAMADRGDNVLATRADEAVYMAVKKDCPQAEYHSLARIVSLRNRAFPLVNDHTIGVVTAGTSDLPVSEEAALTAEFYGNKVLRINDVGVAGIHRLLNRLEDIRNCRVLIVAAGMGGCPSQCRGRSGG